MLFRSSERWLSEMGINVVDALGCTVEDGVGRILGFFAVEGWTI